MYSSSYGGGATVASLERVRAALRGAVGPDRAADPGLEALARAARVWWLHDVSPRTRPPDVRRTLQLVVDGAVRIECVDAPQGAGRSGRRRATLDWLAPTEFLLLSPAPEGGPTTRLAAHPHVGGDAAVLLAEWSMADVLSVAVHLQPATLCAVWDNLVAGLSRRLMVQRRVLDGSVADGLEAVARDLAARFPRPHELGVLVDLQLSDDALAQAVGSERSTVNRRIAALQDAGIVTRPSRGLLVLRARTADRELDTSHGRET